MWAGKPQCSQDSSQARLVLHRSNCGEVRVSDEFPECGVIRKRTNLNLLHSDRSEEHTSELQSPCTIVCRLLLDKKKKPTSLDVFNMDLTLDGRRLVFVART